MTGLRASEIKNEDGDFYDWCQNLGNGQIDEDTLLCWTLSSEPLATLLKLYEQTAETCPMCGGNGKAGTIKRLNHPDKVWDCPTCSGAGKVHNLDRLVVLAEDQTLPEADYPLLPASAVNAYDTAQQDMLNAGFRKVKEVKNG
ncbi:MAG: hypothetical protein WC479_07475 [Candidatus Izemoplasmatales bacterium]|jgi:excinuclease UvrABC ATPase subunit